MNQWEPFTMPGHVIGAGTSTSFTDQDSSVSGPLGHSGGQSVSGGLLPRGWQAAAPRWHRGCVHMYLRGRKCVDSDCLFLHDLTAQEVAALRASSQEHFHEIFSENSAGSAINTKRPGVDSAAAAFGSDPLSDKLLMHTRRQCKVCYFFNLPEGCSDGDNCRFCHFAHQPDGRVIKPRPCKGKRERQRKFLNRIAKEVKANPDGFDVLTVALPPSAMKNQTTERMFRARLVEHVKWVRRRLADGLPPSLDDLGPDQDFDDFERDFDDWDEVWLNKHIVSL